MCNISVVNFVYRFVGYFVRPDVRGKKKLVIVSDGLG
jgi:hypothetical protein